MSEVTKILTAIDQGDKQAASRLLPFIYDELRRLAAATDRLGELVTPWKKFLESNPENHDDWYGYAELCLFLAEDKEYARARHALLDHFKESASPNIAERTGRACLLKPGSIEEIQQAAALADRAVAAGSKHPHFIYFAVAKGLAEYRQDRFESAIDWLKKGIAGGSTMPARIVLAMAQHRLGKLEEARQTLVTAISSYDWKQAPVKNHDVWICNVLRREAERMMIPHLDSFLKGEYEPKDTQERLQLAHSSWVQLRPLAAVQLYVAAFKADPKIAEDLKAHHRYNAACCAVLAAERLGKDVQGLDTEERTHWRKQALVWLRADLAAHTKLLQDGNADDRAFVNQQLRRWESCYDLVAACGPDAVAKLPAEARYAWKTLWANVEELLKKANEKSK